MRFDFTFGRRCIGLAGLIALSVVALIAIPAQAESVANQDDAVTGLTLSAGSAAGELDVNWDSHPAGAENYRVAWAPADESFKPITETNWNAYPTVNQLTVSGLNPGQEYRVRVRAKFGIGLKSDWSEVVTAASAEDYAAERADAVSLGDLADTAPTNLQGAVDDADGIDYFRFSLSENRKVGLRIRSLAYNADLYVEDNSGVVIASSENTGDNKEVLNLTLDATNAGEFYYVRVEAKEAGQNAYTFRYLSEAPPPAPDTALDRILPPPSLAFVEEQALVSARAVATGQPTISGAPQVGDDLTAGTSDIRDGDGLGTFAFQWIRVDADGTSNPTNVGSNSDTYTLAPGDEGKRLKVSVSFTDGGTPPTLETVTSDVYPENGFPSALIAPAKTTCPTDHDWCAEMTVGFDYARGNFVHYGYDDKFGLMDGIYFEDDNNFNGGAPFTYEGKNFVVYAMRIAGEKGDLPASTLYVDIWDLDSEDSRDLHIPRGSVLKLGPTTLIPDAESEGGIGYDEWTLPAGMNWTEDQKVTVSLEFNHAPSFQADSATRSLNETNGDATIGAALSVGAPLPTATDADGDALTYALEGAGADKFAVGSNGVLLTKAGELYDYESETSYALTLNASDGRGLTGTLDLTVNILDLDEPPQPPSAPTVTATPGSYSSLDVSWTPPANVARPAISSYDLRYRSISTATWIDGPQDLTDASTSITGLSANTSYLVQVRATNDEGDGPWSILGTGATAQNLPGTVSLSSTDPTEGFQISAELDDPDDSVNGTTWQWARSGNRSFGFTDISGATSATYTPTADDFDMYLRATASYRDGFGVSRTAFAVPANKVQPRPPDLVGNTRRSAGSIAVDMSWENKNAVVGTIEYVWDEDWYKVPLTSGTRYQIDIRGESSWEYFNKNPNSAASLSYGPTATLTLRHAYLRNIYDNRGHAIDDTQQTFGGIGSDVSFQFIPTYTGYHYIGVSGGATGVYDLSVISNPQQ